MKVFDATVRTKTVSLTGDEEFDVRYPWGFGKFRVITVEVFNGYFTFRGFRLRRGKRRKRSPVMFINRDYRTREQAPVMPAKVGWAVDAALADLHLEAAKQQ